MELSNLKIKRKKSIHKRECKKNSLLNCEFTANRGDQKKDNDELGRELTRFILPFKGKFIYNNMLLVVDS